MQIIILFLCFFIKKKCVYLQFLYLRADRIIHLCEMKFSKEPFRIYSDYELKLRDRMGLFREKNRSTKTLVNTFVTTFGVADGKHSSIVHSEVTMDQLFVP